MKPWKQWVGAFLALCVALAGAVGLSPQWHLWVEHAGDGTPHTHWHGSDASSAAVSHGHPHPAWVASSGITTHRASPALRLVAAHRSPALFGLQPADVFRMIGSMLAGLLDGHAPDPGRQSGHTHHSLAQTLAAGTVEGGLDVPAIGCVLAPIAFLVPADVVVFPPCALVVQAAPRAPPV